MLRLGVSHDKVLLYLEMRPRPNGSMGIHQKGRRAQIGLVGTSRGHVMRKKATVIRYYPLTIKEIS